MGSIDLHGGVDEVKRGVDEIRRIPLRSRQDRRKRDNDSPMPRSHTSVTPFVNPTAMEAKQTAADTASAANNDAAPRARTTLPPLLQRRAGGLLSSSSASA